MERIKITYNRQKRGKGWTICRVIRCRFNSGDFVCTNGEEVWDGTKRRIEKPCEHYETDPIFGGIK